MKETPQTWVGFYVKGTVRKRRVIHFIMSFREINNLFHLEKFNIF